MSKFNTKKEKVIPTTVNEMGEKAYKLAAKEELVSTCLTTFLQSSYYESENEITNRIKNSANKVDEKFVAKLALYLRKDANMRSVTHLLAGEIAPRLSGKEYAARFFNKVAQRPDDMSEILAYYFSKGNKAISNAIKKGFKSKLESLDPYLIDKYKMEKKDISLIDLVNLFHPNPTQYNAEAYKRLMKGESLDGTYSSVNFEKAMTKAGIEAKSEKKDVKETKAKAISEVLDSEKGMNMMTLVRNLRNIIEISPEKLDDAIEQLTNKNKVLKSKLLPFRFASAYEEVSKLKKEYKSVVKFEKTESNNVDKVLKALEKALEYSVLNIPKLSGNTAVLIDHSGSVRGDGGGSSLVSAFSKTTKANIGNLFGSMLAHSQDNVYIGLFGDRLINVPMRRDMGILEFNKFSFNEGAKCGGSTENGLYYFLRDCIENKTRVDNLIIFSDMVIGDGGKGGWDASSNARLGKFQELFKKFKQVNPQCSTISVNISQTSGKDVFDKSLNVTQVAGWSDKIFDIVASRSKGYEAIIKEIESIVI